MGTRINITVDSEGLLERSQQQVDVNRMNLLFDAARDKTEQEGVDRRNQDLFAAGIDPQTRRPLDSDALALTTNFEEPGAYRRGTLLTGHGWTLRGTPTGEEVTGISTYRTAITGQFPYQFTGPAENNINFTAEVLIGSGNGDVWDAYTTGVIGPEPPLPEDNFEITETIVNGPLDRTMFVGSRTTATSSNDSRTTFTALPAGGDRFIFIVRNRSVWNHLFITGLYRYIIITSTGERTDSPFTNATLDFLRERTGEENVEQVPIPDFGYLSGEMQSGSTDTLRAFIVSSTLLREIEVPETLLGIMDQASPDPITEVQSYPVRQRILSLDRVFKDFDTLVLPQGTPLPTGSSLNSRFAGVSFTYTPIVYEQLNATYEFTAPENIKQFSSNKRGGLIDASRGGYSNYSVLSDLYRNGAPLYNALWPVPGQEPNLEVWSPSYTGNIRPKRVNRPGLIFSENRVDRTEIYTEERFITVWDWDTPAYCRFMLKELGFSDEDINPAQPEPVPEL